MHDNNNNFSMVFTGTTKFLGKKIKELNVKIKLKKKIRKLKAIHRFSYR